MRARMIACLLLSAVLFAGCDSFVPKETYDQAQNEIMNLKQQKNQMFQWFVIILIANNVAWLYFYSRKPTRKVNLDT